MVLEGAREWYHNFVKKVDERSSSQVLIQVVVLNAMKPRRLSARVILQASVYTVIIIVLAFILLYTFLLTYVDRHLKMTASSQAQAHLPLEIPQKNTHNNHRVKFQSKSSGNYRLHNMEEGGGNENTLHFHTGSISHRKVLWNSSNYYDVFSTRPQCHRNTSLLTIIITSSPDHLDQRSQIRQTWCNASAARHQKGAWHCVFLIGQTPLSYIDSAVEEEADNFQDILRGTYVDSYRNLTLKVLHGLNWVSQLCPTQYTLKTDDDCFVNTLQMYNFLLHSNTIKTNLYVGNVFHKLEKRKVVRSLSSKWSVAKSDYAPDHYPPYASGTGYVFTQDVVDKIVVESQYIKAIPNEDAYIGIVVNSLGVKPTSSFRFTLFSEGLRLCNYLYVLVVHRVQPEQQHMLHAGMMQAPQACRGDTGDLHSWS